MGIALRQIWTICGVFLNIVSCGYHLGYPTIMLRDLKGPGSTIQLTLDQESWITSAIAISTLPATLLTAPIMQKFGRKAAHYCLVTPSIISCVLLYFAEDVTALIVARMASGFSIGASMTVAAIIVGEYTSPAYRGVFLNAKTAGAMLGVFIVHTLGIFFEWRTLALLGLIPSGCSLLITYTWPESPAWLAYKGRYEECEIAFTWLRGKSENAKEELELLIQTQKKRRFEQMSSEKDSILRRLRNFFVTFGRKDFLKPMSISFFVFVILESCGRHSFPSYAVKFMSAFTKDKSLTLYYVAAVDIIILLASIGSCVIVKIFRRRSLLFISGGISSVLLLSICLCLYLKFNHIVADDNLWAPVSLLALYFVILNLGTSSIALSLIGEIFPLEHRGIGTVVSGTFCSLSLLVTLKVTPALMSTIEVHGTFLIYALCMISSLIYLYFFLPETNGKTLQEIENNFNGIPNKNERDRKDEALLNDC